jgi:predicted O-methyltransferase YrrM
VNAPLQAFSNLVPRKLKRLAQKVFLPMPVVARHAEYSMLFSADDAPGRSSERLLGLALEAIEAARKQDLSSIQARLKGRFRFPDTIVSTWPGEHYKLLAGLVQVMTPKRVVEVGTAEGMSALTLKRHLPEGGKVVTFDIIPWRDYPNPCLNESDFLDGSLEQVVADLGDPNCVCKHKDLLESTDLFFIDAAKDGVLERRLIENLGSLSHRRSPIVVFDDIRLWNMLAIWRGLEWPKLDLTSFGHWSGTGISEIPIRAPARS